MPATVVQRADQGEQMTVMIGVDPHKASHTAVAIPETEQASPSWRSVSAPGRCSRCWTGQRPPPTAPRTSKAPRGSATCWPGRSCRLASGPSTFSPGHGAALGRPPEGAALWDAPRAGSHRENSTARSCASSSTGRRPTRCSAPISSSTRSPDRQAPPWRRDSLTKHALASVHGADRASIEPAAALRSCQES